ncbi:hypothetical protein [Crossiella sp. NPDC003009]
MTVGKSLWANDLLSASDDELTIELYARHHGRGEAVGDAARALGLTAERAATLLRAYAESAWDRPERTPDDMAVIRDRCVRMYEQGWDRAGIAVTQRIKRDDVPRLLRQAGVPLRGWRPALAIDRTVFL